MPDTKVKVNISMLSWMFQQKNWAKNLLIYSIVAYIPVVNFLTMGYLMKIMKSSLEGVEGLPEWTDLGEIVLLALQQLIIVMVYGFVIMIPAYIIGGIFLLIGIFISKALGGVLFFLSFTALMVFLYPMSFVALTRFAKREGLGDAFDIKNIWVVFKRTFGQLILLGLLLSFTMLIIVLLFAVPAIALLAFKSLFLLLPLMLLLIGPMNFWLNSTFFYFGTKICMDAEPEDFLDLASDLPPN